ncbi:hypothetical protein [Halorussus aquaticus]|uniref:Uncharacterized protein n=1 Tax=Halorussus aquaticus TaxID=2953748 RepID=A0ABD5Q373_9EURY|nr:hypothetical protein [Halorussus aquaticus]
MASIQTHRVPGPDGSGPYAYRVEWNGEDHDWTYLGPAGSLDPEAPANGDPLTDSEIAQLREENFGFARYRESAEADLYKKELANSFREDMEERFPNRNVFAPSDDKRTTTVELAEDAPATVKQLLSERSTDMQAELDSSAGQVPLSDSERDEIDFTQDNMDTFTARRAKAAVLDEGIPESSWMDVWSDDLTTTGEAREAAKRNRESIVGDRTDENEDMGGGTSNAEFRSQQEESALKYAKEEGDDDARDYLLNEAGWTEERIENTPVPA